MADKERPIRSALRQYFPFVAVFVKGLGLLYSKRSMLRATGYIESVKTKRPCRSDGTPIPWMNYNAISFFEDRLTTDLTLFEYGSGNSTKFFAALVGKVTSVECDREWYEHVLEEMPENVSLTFVAMDGTEPYCESIGKSSAKFDVIIVDAHDRNACMQQSSEWVTERGVIVLDDAQRERYQSGTNFLLDRGFRKLDFEGLKPGGIRAYRTTIFYRDNNCLGI